MKKSTELYMQEYRDKNPKSTLGDSYQNMLIATLDYPLGNALESPNAVTIQRSSSQTAGGNGLAISGEYGILKLSFAWEYGAGTDLDIAVQVIEPFIGTSFGYGEVNQDPKNILMWGNDDINSQGEEAILVALHKYKENNATTPIKITVKGHWFSTKSSGAIKMCVSAYPKTDKITQTNNTYTMGIDAVAQDCLNFVVQNQRPAEKQLIATVVYDPITNICTINPDGQVTNTSLVGTNTHIPKTGAGNNDDIDLLAHYILAKS